MRRVDVQKQRTVLERREHFRCELADSDVAQQSPHFQVPRLDPTPCRLGASRGVHSAERLDAASRAGHYYVGLLARAEFGHERLEERRRYKWQVARQDDHAVMRGIGERRMQSAKRAGPRDLIRDDAHTECRVPPRIVADDSDVVRHRVEHCQLTFDDARASDDERRLVGAAESAGAATRENGRRDLGHNRRYHRHSGPSARQRGAATRRRADD